MYGLELFTYNWVAKSVNVWYSGRIWIGLLGIQYGSSLGSSGCSNGDIVNLHNLQTNKLKTAAMATNHAVGTSARMACELAVREARSPMFLFLLERTLMGDCLLTELCRCKMLCSM